MSPQDQIRNLMAAVQDPPNIVVPCKANQTHRISIRMRFDDDSHPAPTTPFQIYRGKSSFLNDRIAVGSFDKAKVPPGPYRIFFPDIHADELEEE